MKNILLYFILILTIFPAIAQRGPGNEADREKIEAARVAFITKRLDLTPQQAEKFWPKFNQHSQERRSLMREMSNLMKVEESSLTDEKANNILERKFQIEQEMLNQSKGFMKDIVSVISPVQALRLSEVNRDFTRHIYRMQRQRGGQGSRNGSHTQNPEIIDNVKLWPAKYIKTID